MKQPKAERRIVMADRRDFLKASLMVAAGLAVSRVSPAPAGDFPAGLIYTTAAPGRWAGKEKSHAPVVTRDGNRITVTTNHPMSVPHFIVRHTLVSANGETLGDKTFTAASEKAESVFELVAGQEPRYATSFCNQHDFWVTEI
jgi:superoxide reductase